MNPTRQTIVVTGANRGIGLEFARQWLERGASVIATARDIDAAEALITLREAHPDLLRVMPLDVSDEASVQQLAFALEGVPIQLLINNAGVAGRGGFRDLATDVALHVFNVNALGPLRVTRALHPNLVLGAPSKVVCITSGLGSIGDNTSGGSYAYRMSKAALNMVSRNMAHDLRAQGISVIALTPGHVRTDMGGSRAPTSPAESIAAMNAVIDRLTLEDTGRFFSWTGKEFPW
jgi:NAD(P)-dependent dehydrogenase (short-subunit alcohol dehydrogenase family)